MLAVLYFLYLVLILALPDILHMYRSWWLSMSITVCTGAHSFCNTCILFPIPVNCSCSSNYNSDKWYFPDRQQLVFVFQWCWDKQNLNKLHILLHYHKLYQYDTETEFIRRTLLKMSQGTANPKQNLQNDMCILGRLRSDYAVRVVCSEAEQRLRWRSPGFLAGIQGLWVDCTEVQADLSFCWAYIHFCLCWPAARASPTRNLVTFVWQAVLRSSYFAGRGVRAAGHFPYTLVLIMALP